MVPALDMVTILVLAAILVLVPRALFNEAGGRPPSRRLELALTGALAAAGSAAAFGLGAPVQSRLVLAAALMVLMAVIYADLRFLVIPDLYSLILVVLALVGPLALGFGAAVLGAAVCGGLLALVAVVWKRTTDVEGMGFGDVKLAAAVGGLLGAQHGLWAIAASAGGAALLGYGFKALRRGDREAPLLAPYGAALALAAAGFLIWSRA